MSYSDNAIVNEVCLVVINDGDGRDCGYSYHARCDAFRHALLYGDSSLDLARFMARKAATSLRREGLLAGTRRLGVRAEAEAAEIISDYYKRHLKECGLT